MSVARRLLAIYGIFEILLLISSFFMDKSWFYSTQVAFFGSLLILFATFKSYQRRVLSRVENEKFILDDDYYDEDEGSEWGENFTEYTDDGKKILKKGEKAEEILEQELDPKEILKKEKEAMKNMPKFANLHTALVPFRLIAYAVLVLGFLALNRHGNLNIIGFLIALGIMPIGALVYGVMSRADKQ